MCVCVFVCVCEKEREMERRGERDSERGGDCGVCARGESRSLVAKLDLGWIRTPSAGMGMWE